MPVNCCRCPEAEEFYGTGGIVPRFLPETRGSGQGGTPMFHFKGTQVSQTLANLRVRTLEAWPTRTKCEEGSEAGIEGELPSPFELSSTVWRVHSRPIFDAGRDG